MKTKFGSFITVRTRSSRMPAKCLLKIRGKSVIEHVIDRAKQTKKIDVVILCTTTNSEDDILVDIAKKKGIKYFRGSEKDKLERWNGAAKKFNIDYFVTTDADDLFCDPELNDLAVEQMLEKPCDMIKAPANLVCGSFTYCISVVALKRVCKIKASRDTEMMWGYFIDTGLFNVRQLKVKDRIFHNKKIRMTLDYPEDFVFFWTVFDKLRININNLPLRKILKFLKLNPAIPKINFFRQNQFLQNQKQKTNILLKKNYEGG